MHRILVPQQALSVRPCALFWRGLPSVVRYGVAAGLTQVIYLGVLVGALVVQMHYMAAVGVAQVAAFSYAFPMYRLQVFEAREGPILRQLGAFFGVWWLGAATSLLGVPLLVEGLDYTPLAAQLLVLGVTFVGNYVVHRGVTFRPSQQVADNSTAGQIR